MCRADARHGQAVFSAEDRRHCEVVTCGGIHAALLRKRGIGKEKLWEQVLCPRLVRVLLGYAAVHIYAGADLVAAGLNDAIGDVLAIGRRYYNTADHVRHL